MGDKHFFSFDIGGTSIRAAKVSIGPQHYKVESILSVPTKRGVPGILSILGQHYQRLYNLYKKRLPIHIGFPGKFQPNTLIIGPGSARNLEAFPGELSNYDLTIGLKDLFMDKQPIYCENDAVSQARGGLRQLKQNGHDISGNKIAYIGTGTGLGGAFGYWDGLCLDTYTNGHVFDMALSNREGIAEKWVSGAAFLQLTGYSALEVSQNLDLFLQLKTHIHAMGLDLAGLIYQLHTGTISWYQDSDAWPKNDIDKVKGTPIFILGGSLGAKSPFSNLLLSSINAFYKDIENRPKVLTVPNPNFAGLLGCI